VRGEPRRCDAGGEVDGPGVVHHDGANLLRLGARPAAVGLALATEEEQTVAAGDGAAQDGRTVVAACWDSHARSEP
jgi:hypothetical protein